MSSTEEGVRGPISRAPDPVPAPVHPPGYYRYEPFKADNTAALKSGVRSKRFYEPLAVEIANDLMTKHERLTNPLYRESVLNYARTLAKIELSEKHLAEVGMVDSDNEPRNAMKVWMKLVTMAANQAAQLGLTPLANARLGKDSAATRLDLAALAARMAKTIDGEVESEGTS